MASIPFVDLKSQYARLEADINAGIHKVLNHGQYILGPEIGELERALADFTGARHAITCASGTDALVMALMALDIGPGKAVFTTPFTFVATAEAIALTGATPVFVDIEPDTFNLDPAALETTVARVAGEGALAPAAVIPVDLFGLLADYGSIEAIARRWGLKVIADAAQSFGGERGGKKAGSYGDIAATSFFPAKPLGCYGDGGAVFTGDDGLAGIMRSIRVHGQGVDKYENVRVGLNARMDTIQAAVLLPKLRVFPEELKMRQRVAERYTQGLSGKVATPAIPHGCVSAWAQYSILTGRRDALRDALAAKGIPTAVYYPIPLHLQKAFAHLGHKAGDFPVSEDAARRIVSLPFSPYLKDETIDFIVSEILRAV